MVIRDNAEIRRFWRKIAHSASQALVWMVCAVCLSAGDANSAPYAQPGQAVQSWRDWAARPVIRAGLCGEYGDPCPETYEQRRYVARPVHKRRWEPDPAPYPDEETVEVHAKPDCVDERYAVHTYTVREPAPAPRHSEEPYPERCGIKCWYKRLRGGYCGRGCDYYRFRMTQFPEGKLSNHRVRVACR